jgi:peptidoglycan/xylan/chitin deacetylase (PgdA/CDA1 family)
MFSARVFRKLASPLLYLSGAYGRHWQRRALLEPFTVVLVYHRVVEDGASQSGRYGIERGTPASVFESQIRFMRRHFVPIQASQALESAGHPLRFAVTLDDGYEDNFRVAAPILRRLGVSATFFVVSDYVGSDRLFWWEQLAEMTRATRVPSIDPRAVALDSAATDMVDLPLRTFAERRRAFERLSLLLRRGPHSALAGNLERIAQALAVRPRAQGRDYALMNWEQLNTLVRQGFEIGGHTATHCNVAGADRALLQTEIVASARTLSNRIDAPVLSFAYPYGIYDRNDRGVPDMLREVGCRVAFTGTKGAVTANLDPFALPRAPVNRRFHFACAYNVQDALDHSRPLAAHGATV